MDTTACNRPVPAFPVVGIGASAGGFEALAALLGGLPPCPGMALVVVLHLAAQERSGAARVLQGATALPVIEVGHSMPVLPDRVYVIPPGSSLRIERQPEGELLALGELERDSTGPVAIDLFLSSLAEARGAQAVGVLLSGAGTDGSAGLARIRALGGVTIVQRPDQAGQDGMPRAAIAAGVADFVLEAGAIAHKLAELCAPLDAREPPVPARPVQRRARLFSYADIHLHRAAALAPPSILLDADGDVLHLSEGALPFVRPAPGEPARDLIALVLPALRPALRAALFQAQRTGLPASTGPVGHEGTQALDIHVLPFRDGDAGADLLLVSFHRLPDLAPASPAASEAHDGALLRRLEDEVLRLRGTLQRTIDQAEAHIADLAVRGEELLSTIEELHATTDELERRNGELRAANDALASERERLRDALAEASQAHDDLANLVASSDVATLFLDREMRIVRYTPRIACFFNLIPADVGRPLAHISNRLGRPRLAAEAAAVFQTLQPMECEVRAADGRDYAVRVHPYRASGNRIAGAVMSFFDISSRRAAEAALRASEARLSTVFATLPAGVGVIDPTGAVLMANDELRHYLPTGRMPSVDTDRLPRWRAWAPDGRPLGREEFPGARALRGERVVPGIEMRYTHDDGRETWTQVASVPLRDEAGAVVGQVAIVTDIDALKRSEAALRENEARLCGLVCGLAQAVWEAAPDGRVVHDSPSWRAYTGQALAEWVGDGWLGAVHPDDREQALRQWRDAVARRAGLDTRFRVRRIDGRWCWSTVRAAPLLDRDGSIRKWVGMNFEATPQPQ